MNETSTGSVAYRIYEVIISKKLLTKVYQTVFITRLVSFAESKIIIMKKCKRFLTLLFALTIVIQSVFNNCIYLSAETVDEDDDFSIDAILDFEDENTADPIPLEENAVAVNDSDDTAMYINYYTQHSQTKRYNGFVTSGSEAVSDASRVVSYEDKNAVILESSSPGCEWNIAVPEAAMYAIYLDYYPLPASSGNDIVFSLKVDGKRPYDESQSFSLRRMWKDYADEDGVVIATDRNGDDKQPKQIQAPCWMSAAILDSQGMYNEPYLIYLEPGAHKLYLETMAESFAVSKISLGNEESPIFYSDYISRYGEADYASGDTVILQAESAFSKNSSVLYPTYDRTSAAVTPNDSANKRLNTIGQQNWSKNGQEISWEVNVSEPGLYQMAFHANQDFNQAMNSYRTLKVNGAVPFAEAENISFKYNSSWYMKVLGDEEPIYLYLNPGDIITLTCVPGEMSNVLMNVQLCVLELNTIYRQIIAITGTSPDIYQDYSLSGQIQDLEEQLLSVKQTLDETTKEVKSILGNSGGQASTINQVSIMLGELGEDTDDIPERLSSFKTEIENLGSLIISLQQQPLELDFIAFVPRGNDIPTGKAGLLKSAKYSIGKFLYSFIGVYSSSETGSGKTLKVWVSTGRDQMQLISNMIGDSFTEETGVNVKLSLIDTGTTMLQATLAGKGPDVAIMVGKDLPVNLAMRGALVDLSGFDYEKLKSETVKAAWEPFYYNGGLYALPESMAFDLLFYRKDIFKQYGLEVPQTWDNFYSVMEVLQKNNFGVGLQEINSANNGVSSAINIFNMFLFQNGGTYYNDTLTETEFDTEVAYRSFSRWVDIYRKFGVDRDISFYNRFRSGEMPMGIVGYGTYCQLISAAPEINGLWEFAEIPGTMQSDGTVDRSQSATVTGSIILKAAEAHGLLDEAYSFISWWTSEEVQLRYAKDLEAMLGVAARYSPANLKVLESIGWSASELSVLKNSITATKNVREIPGNYIVSRCLTNALRSAINGKNDARRSLTLYNRDINDEITRKRTEFGLD